MVIKALNTLELTKPGDFVTHETLWFKNEFTEGLQLRSTKKREYASVVVLVRLISYKKVCYFQFYLVLTLLKLYLAQVLMPLATAPQIYMQSNLSKLYTKGPVGSSQ